MSQSYLVVLQFLTKYYLEINYIADIVASATFLLGVIAISPSINVCAKDEE